MASDNILRELYQALGEDKWRRTNPFSGDIAIADGVLLNPFSSSAQCAEQLSNWLQKNQPCIFGQATAAIGRLHFCFLTEEDILTKSDSNIKDVIHSRVLEWKRRSLQPIQDFSTPAHGFVLAAIAPRISRAAPDAHLRDFAMKVRELWGPPASEERSGKVTWETLYLQNPADRRYFKFTFSVDFFASAGDGRWWSDHRCPGGILFTANSVGHLRSYREWYEGHGDQTEWTLKNAMNTIRKAADTRYGKATWLRPLLNGQPVVQRFPCPFSTPDPRLEGKDWTRYGGYLHTDHSIRSEFFHEEPEKLSEVSEREYLEDFTYLYDKQAKDYIRFVQGAPVSEEEVYDELGNPESWITVVGREPRAALSGPFRSPEGRVGVAGRRAKAAIPASERRKIGKHLSEGRKWRLSPKQRRLLLE